MSGRVVVEGNASQSAAATAHGGLLVVCGDASARCAISLKGADVVVRGSVGHMSAFMAQTGRLVVCGDAGEALGDSIYEARLYVAGDVAGSGRTAWRRRCVPSTSPRCAGSWSRRRSMTSTLRRSGGTARHDGSTLSRSTTPTDGLGQALAHLRTARATGVRALRPRDHRGDPARRAGRDLRHPRLRRQATAAAFRRPARPRREHLPVPA